MRPHFAMTLFAVAVAGSVGTAGAQSIPAGQSCGGLLCDMGIWGRTSAPTPASNLASLPPAKAAPAPAAQAETPAAPRRRSGVAVPKTPVVRTPKQMAKANSGQMRAAPQANVASQDSALSQKTAARQQTAAPEPAAVAPVNRPTLLGNPFASAQPSPFLFQPIDPRFR